MTIYSAGTGPYQFITPIASGAYFTTGGSYDAAWVSSCLYISNTASTAFMKPWTPLTECWFHFEGVNPNRSYVRDMVNLRNSSSASRVRINGAQQFQFWNGSSWVTLGTVLASGSRRQYDIFVKVHATEGEVTLYIDKEIIGSFEGDTSGIGNITDATFNNPIQFGSDPSMYSQILVCDFPTLFAKVKQTVPNANGFHTAWNGDVLDVDNVLPGVATSVSTPTIGAKESFKAAARDFTGYDVKGIIANISALRGGAGAPSHIKQFFRVGSVDYPAPVSKILAYGSKEFSDTFELNPATGVAWTPAEAGSVDLEFGVEARNS